MEQVLELLSELGGTATVRQMVDHARKKSLGKDLTHSIKVLRLPHSAQAQGRGHGKRRLVKLRRRSVGAGKIGPGGAKTAPESLQQLNSGNDNATAL